MKLNKKSLKSKPPAQIELKIEKTHAEIETKITLYDRFSELVSWVVDGLEVVDYKSGEIRDLEINKWLLESAHQEMAKLEHAKVKKMAERLANHQEKLLTFLDWLATPLAALKMELSQYLESELLEKHLRRLTARYWRVNHAVLSLKQRGSAALRTYLESEIEAWTTGDEFLIGWIKRLLSLLEWTQRTSSAAENVNSILKPMLRRKKHFKSGLSLERFVALFVLWHNLRVFKEGKRKGKSPYSILGIDLGEKDWRTLLGYPPLQ